MNQPSALTAQTPLNDWLSWQEQYHVKEIDLGLDRVSAVYNLLKQQNYSTKPPEKQSVKSVYTITVAGTNGKGSCVAYLESILVTAGYKVGVYSTPHLLAYNERIRLNGKPVSDPLITHSFAKINSVREHVSLSYFEFGTLAALDIFAEQQVDIQILEVGLGGRLDAVNIIDADAALITSIDIDHVDWLGDDIFKIAVEKAGIFRNNQVAVCGDRTVPKSLLDYANTLNIQLQLAGRDFDIQMHTDEWQLMAEHLFAAFYPMPSLNGAHQIQNAAAVITLLASIHKDIPVSKASLNKGLQETTLMGRVQVIDMKPTIILDVAHNPESAVALAEYIRSCYSNKTIHAVFSILAGKDVTHVTSPFVGLVNQWHIALLDVHRAESIEHMSNLLKKQGVKKYKTYASIKAALNEARSIAGDEDLVVCFGSFYVVEACLEAL
ncbi:MAG: bifunctional tetrahydrofolate synthase/dihydrofolate synthase [Cycloclasticus sp.]|nr:MAG: bifunctional tetrahydrofolate synthase/dihydrofolate synthase [Cycloclasticus sp.]